MWNVAVLGWAKRPLSLLNVRRAKAGVPLAGKQRDVAHKHRKTSSEDLKASQRIGHARAQPVPPAPPPTPPHQLWQSQTPPSTANPLSSGTSSLYRPKDLYEPLRQLLISPPINETSTPPASENDTEKDAETQNGPARSGSQHHRPKPLPAAKAAPSEASRPVTAPHTVNLPARDQPKGGSLVGAVMSSLNLSSIVAEKMSVSPGPAKIKGVGGLAAIGKAAPNGLHCRTLAEDLAFSWPELQERFQSLAPHVRQVRRTRAWPTWGPVLENPKHAIMCLGLWSVDEPHADVEEQQSRADDDDDDERFKVCLGPGRRPSD